MIKNPRNNPGYCEEFDLEALSELAQMAFYDVVVETGGNIPKGQKTIPDGTYSDFACNVWELFRRVVEDGMALERSTRGES